MFLKDLLFPKFCLGCGFLGAYICLNCQKKLSYSERDSCLYCGRASLSGFTHPGCKRKNSVDGLLSIFYYNNFLKAIIKSIKYRLATAVFRELCLVVKPEKISKLKIFKELDQGSFYLQPIPLFPGKLKARGFNQAKLITNFFNRFLGFELSESLIRVKDTFSQAQTRTNQKRYTNILGAFEALDKGVKAKNIILVDDVVTTGSTVKEAARILKQNGAKKVYVLTLAKG